MSRRQNPTSHPSQTTGHDLIPGDTVDLATLRAMKEDNDIEVWIYFDEDLARSSSIEADLKAFEFVAEPARPFLELRRFLQYMESREPGFTETIGSMKTEVVAVGEREAFCACVLCPRSYVKVLLR
ncbi:hypothetical protein RJ40_06760 [Methanofollis aquaemaris]|uniref:Uncharacterized protein n=1 Tax=Methanofollis aquaemaris TaxID=126734 RepID=A0A8A3S682_9EURY|nr:hypothetical protein [Methanofollis aquaemaris]QSZ67221.1 hypothetical protein RJ40_06760 [Methanofollis aquaemaris]